jgi:hypothetical protein
VEDFARDNPICTLLIVLAILATIRALVPWARRDRDAESGSPALRIVSRSAHLRDADDF